MVFKWSDNIYLYSIQFLNRNNNKILIEINYKHIHGGNKSVLFDFIGLCGHTNIFIVFFKLYYLLFTVFWKTIVSNYKIVSLMIYFHLFPCFIEFFIGSIQINQQGQIMSYNRVNKPFNNQNFEGRYINGDFHNVVGRYK